MTWWRVSTEHKKNVYEHELWQKDDWVIRRITGFRWGTVRLETAGEEPVLDQTDGPGADAVDMYMTDYEYELDSLDDGWYAETIFPDDMPEEEQERLEQLWEDESYAGWESEGWEQYECECWFHGPLEIAEIVDVDESVKDEWLARKLDIADDGYVGAGSAPTWPFPTGNPNKGDI